MRKQKIKDIKIRTLFKGLETSHIRLNLINRVKGKNFLFKLENNKVFVPHVKIVNRCIISNRKKCVHKKFRVSRIMLRSLASSGLIIGLKKASF